MLVYQRVYEVIKNVGPGLWRVQHQPLMTAQSKVAMEAVCGAVELALELVENFSYQNRSWFSMDDWKIERHLRFLTNTKVHLAWRWCWWWAAGYRSLDPGSIVLHLTLETNLLWLFHSMLFSFFGIIHLLIYTWLTLLLTSSRKPMSQQSQRR